MASSSRNLSFSNNTLGSSYPPQPYSTINSTTTIETKVGDDRTHLSSRTPSPTPSELKELKTGAIDWKAMTKKKFWFRREWLWYYVILVVILIVTALVTIYHKQIVNWLSPVTKRLQGLSLGWLVPIGVLFVISFPPLFGHEIVAILCGLVWGLWVGFGIVAAGTFLGEVGNFYAFKYCCRSRGEKLERTKLSYACLARVVRDGGFKIALIARLSAIPGHFTTAIFSTCGMNIFIFSIAAILSMPKQFITVYLGVILEQSGTGTEDKKSKIISDVVLAITFIITVVAMWYILRQMNKVKPQVIYERRKARQAKLMRAEPSSAMGSTSEVFNPNASDVDIPLTSGVDYSHQRWDSQGNAIGYPLDPELQRNEIHAPKPRFSYQQNPVDAFRYPRDEEEMNVRQDSAIAAGWDTMTPNPLPVPGKRRADAPENTRNPYSSPPQHQQQAIKFEANFGRTPTQATFSQAYEYEDPYGGYTTTHAHELTDSTFRTAYSNSPDDLPLTNPHLPRLNSQSSQTAQQSPHVSSSPKSYPGSSNPYPFSMPGMGTSQSQSRTQSPKPPSYKTIGR